MNGQSFIAGALQRIGGAGRKAPPLNLPADGAAAIQYLYVPCARDSGHPGEALRWVQAVPIVKKTARAIYYTSDHWNWREAVVSPGCISREQFEADTRCHREDRCRHGYPAGVIPIPGDRHRAGPASRLFFATRAAAEDNLRGGERDRAGGAGREAALIKELRRALADAHPDRGGPADQFIQAHARYQAALRQSRR